jgi:hypothetical protein
VNCFKGKKCCGCTCLEKVGVALALGGSLAHSMRAAEGEPQLGAVYLTRGVTPALRGTDHPQMVQLLGAGGAALRTRARPLLRHQSFTCARINAATAGHANGGRRSTGGASATAAGNCKARGNGGKMAGMSLHLTSALLACILSSLCSCFSMNFCHFSAAAHAH